MKKIKTPKWVIYFFVALILVITLFFAGVTLLYEVEYMPKNSLTMKDWRNNFQTLNKIKRAIKSNCDKKSDFIDLALTFKEVNSLLRLVGTFKINGVNIGVYELFLNDNGLVSFTYPTAKIGKRQIYFRGETTLGKEGIVLHLNLSKLTLGKVPLPKKLGNYFLQKELLKLKEVEEYQKYAPLVNKLFIDSKKKIVYLQATPKVARFF